MTDTPPPAPRPAPRHDAPPPGGWRGEPHGQAVRAAPDLAQRALTEKRRGRLVIASMGFFLLFGAVALKLAGATVMFPIQRKHGEAKWFARHDRLAQLPNPLGALLLRNPAAPPAASGEPLGSTPADGLPALVPPPPPPQDTGPHTRAMIVDRNGEILALSLPTSGLYANPREMIDTDEAAQKMKAVLPRLDLDVVKARLASEKQFVYLARNITPREELALNNLGIPGVYFQPTERRRYPQGRVAAQVLGGVDVDAHGVAGVERSFDARLRDNPEPLKLSLDVRVQGVVRDELSKSMAEFHAIGACGIVMDVRTGEVVAMVSLPDYDANKAGEATDAQRFNRAVTGMYEPGSTFKLQTAAMALDSGAAQLWSSFDASHDIKIGRFTIKDFEGKHRVLELPEVIAYSSNLGAAHMAQQVGTERQRSWLQAMGMFTRVGIELPEQGQPIVQPAASWKEVATLTVGFGHGIAVSPLHVVRGTAVLANGGMMLHPTILEADGHVGPREPLGSTGTVAPQPPADEHRIMRQSTSDTLRKLMRLVVTDGYGKPADVPGYFVGGKTGTAEKTVGHGYRRHANVSAFMSVFPMNAPRYAVYFMLDEPKGNASTAGYSTAGAVSAPGAGRLIARIAPMLGLMPETATEAATQATLAMPLRPGRPAGWRAPEDAVAAHPPAHQPVPATVTAPHEPTLPVGSTASSPKGTARVAPQPRQEAGPVVTSVAAR